MEISRDGLEDPLIGLCMFGFVGCVVNPAKAWLGSVVADS